MTKRFVYIIIALAISVFSLKATSKGNVVKATKYYPGHNCGWVTADGSRINPKDIKRWVALSHDMFRSGNFHFGDTIVVKCDNEKLCGEWVVKDKMGPRMRGRIDFLMGRNNDYNFNNPMNVTIRRKADMSESELAELELSKMEKISNENVKKIMASLLNFDYQKVLEEMHNTPIKADFGIF